MDTNNNTNSDQGQQNNNLADSSQPVENNSAYETKPDTGSIITQNSNQVNNSPPVSNPVQSESNNAFQQSASFNKSVNQSEQPAVNTSVANNADSSNSSGAVFVLQWVTYALWGWTLLVLSWVIFALVLSIMNQFDMGEAILYPISALLILLPASVVADSFYSKKEPKVKKGGALAIMVIHVVIYVLFMIGFLIGAMFSLVSMTVSSGDSQDATGYLISCILVSLCYALLITRTIRPHTFRRFDETHK